MEEAEQAYAEAIRLDGVDPLARMGLGELRIACGRPRDAAREFELALERRPAMVAAHLGLGNALALAAGTRRHSSGTRRRWRCARTCRKVSLPRDSHWRDWDGRRKRRSVTGERW